MGLSIQEFHRTEANKAWGFKWVCKHFLQLCCQSWHRGKRQNTHLLLFSWKEFAYWGQLLPEGLASDQPTTRYWLKSFWRPKKLVGTFPAFSPSSGNNTKLPAFFWREFVHTSSTPTSATDTQETSPSNHLVLITNRAQHSWFIQDNIKLKKKKAIFKLHSSTFHRNLFPQVQCRGSRQICPPYSFSWKELECILFQLLPVISD